jgi:hypothetical protein
MFEGGYEKLRRSHRQAIERALVMGQGYVLDFSNRTIAIFFEEQLGIEFYSDKFAFNGDSKAKRLRAIFKEVPNLKLATILEKLWDYRTSLPDNYKIDDPDQEKALRSEYFSCISLLKSSPDVPIALDALERFDDSDTLDNLINSIERDIRDDRYSAALDRLHTYCQRRFRKLLESTGRQVSESEPLNSRVGAYLKVLEADGLAPISITIIKSSISVFEKFNDIRNNHSLAHDNDLLDFREARFVLDSIGAVLRFLKSIRGDCF